MQTYEVNDKYLNVLKIPTGGAVKSVPTHHCLVIDVSGSMWRDLADIRRAISERLVRFMGQDDLLSVIWFSGRRQAGALLEGERVGDLGEVARVRALLDRWLRPVGLTGFVEPLQLAADLLERHAASHAGSLVFMSDGWDNLQRRPANALC